MFTWYKRWKLKGLLNTLKKYQHLRESGDAKALPLEIRSLRKVIEFYRKQEYNPNFSQAKLQMFEYARAAASLNDPVSQLECAKTCFDVGRFFETWHRSNYSRPVQEHYMKEAYQQAFEFLNAAEANRSVDAKRYKGLVYINGWGGVPVDAAKGFQLILESIEMANAWSQATKIIDKLGLSSPEFFKALTQYQAKHQG